MSGITSTTEAIGIIGPNFAGGISNAGTISAGSGAYVGIYADGGSIFGGGISNSGGILGGYGISVNLVSDFSGGITNSGTLSTKRVGIGVYSTPTFTGNIANASSGAILSTGSGIVVSSNSSFASNIINSGTISAAGDGIYIFDNSTFFGNVTNSGTISAGSSHVGILANGGSIFGGGIRNSGTISAGYGITVENLSSFSGGIGNSSTGTISAPHIGIDIYTISNFASNITNAGTISASGGDGIYASSVSTFSGDIVNSASGAISAKSGIVLNGVSTFAGGVVNAGGTIAAVTNGIVLNAISKFSGDITNAGVISANSSEGGYGIDLSDVSDVIGRIVNATSGTISVGTASPVGVSGTIGLSDVGVRVIGVSSFASGITNAGTITADAFPMAGPLYTTIAGYGVEVESTSTFAGGITNAGTIGVSNTSSGMVTDGRGTDIRVYGVDDFSGGIVNNGTLSGVGEIVTGIAVRATRFAGGITNTGTISEPAPTLGGVLGGDGIYLDESDVTGASFGGGIVNAATGTISGERGIVMDFVSQGGSETASGGVSNAGVISAQEGGIDVSGGYFTNGIVNSGTISSAGTFTNDSAAIFAGASTFSGGVTNFGSLVGFIAVASSSFSGGVLNSGTISGGIQVRGGMIGDAADDFPDAAYGGPRIPGVSDGVFGVSSFAGGITNTGTITGGGVRVYGFRTLVKYTTPTHSGTTTVVGTFSGNIVNSGTISTTGTAIKLGGPSGTPFGGSITAIGTVSDNFYNDVPSFIGNVTNSGTILARTGLAIETSTIDGAIIDSGIINATSHGILIDSASKVASTTTAIAITGPTFVGGISNSGTLSAADVGVLISGTISFGGDIVNSGLVDPKTGISVSNVSTYSGGITNTSSGVITATAIGIKLNNVSTFAGNVSNAGTISARTGIDIAGSTIAGGLFDSGIVNATNHGILIDNASKVASTTTAIKITGPTFTGGISNAGTISAASNGFYVNSVSTFLGGISNSGTISGYAGIFVLSVSTFSGGIANDGTISAGAVGIDVNGDSAFSGGISNSGTISAVTGLGITVTAETFSGGIGNSGTISVGGVGDGIGVGGGTFSGGISNSGTIVAATVANGILVASLLSFGGGISNAGTISGGLSGIEVGHQDLALTGTTVIIPFAVSTFTGGIRNSGTIKATGGGSAAGIDVENVVQFGGSISNTGTISGAIGIKVGANVTFASGSDIVNTGVITGSTAAIDASAATSPVVIDQNGGTLGGAVKLSTNADFLNVNGGTINGNIVGAGTQDTLNFAPGSGNSLTYGAGYSFTTINQVNVNSGAVVLDGAGNSATNVTIGAGAGLQVGDASNTGAALASANPVDVSGTLSGHGSVLGDVLVENGGTLLPGGSIGTLTVTGALTLSSGSVYSIEISPTNASKTIADSATLNGATVKVVPELGNYSATTYTILTVNTADSTLGTTNTFNPTVSVANGVTLLSPTLSYDANDAYLSIAGGYYTLMLPPGGNENERDVAGDINHYITNGGTLPSDFQALSGLSDGVLLTALDQLSGQDGGGFKLGAFQAGGQFLSLLLNPFNQGRGAGSGVGPALGYARAPRQRVARATARAFAAFDRVPRASFDQRYGVWASGYGGSGTVDGDAITGAATTTSQVYGYAAGLDYRLSPDTTVGFALGGGGTHWGLDLGLGSGHSDMFQSGVYGTTHIGAAYLAAALGYSWYSVTTDRTVNLGGTSRLQGKFHVNALSARLEGGYRLPFGDFSVTPYAAVQTQALYLPSYTETAISGPPAFALSYNSQTATTTRSELGAWFDYSYRLADGANLKLYSRLAWVLDFSFSSTATAFFQSLPGSSFLVNSARPDADGALVTAGARYRLGNGWSLAGKFDGEFSGTTSIFSGTAIIRKQW